MHVRVDSFPVKCEMFCKHVGCVVSNASRLVFDIETRSFRSAGYTERRYK